MKFQKKIPVVLKLVQKFSAWPLLMTLLLFAFPSIVVTAGSVAALEKPHAVGEAASTQKDFAAFKQAIRVKYDLKEKAFREGDVDLLINHFYSKNAVSAGQGQETHQGRDQLRKEYLPLMAKTKYVRIVSRITRQTSPKSGWDYADFYVKLKDKTPEFALKILFLWEKINGEWFCTGYMYGDGELFVAEPAKIK